MRFSSAQVGTGAGWDGGGLGRRRVGTEAAGDAPAERNVRFNDGGYHDETTAKDIRRQEDPRRLGWTVIRFRDKDAENDAESVGRAIANKLGIPYRFKRRLATGSGMRSVRAPKKKTPN